jgi:hypothetical protein
MVGRIESALDAVQAKMRKNGFGPYARSADEIRQRPTPQPLQDADRYAEVQPFAEQAAWIRRGDSPAWELIGGEGQWLVGRSSGYVQARPFSEGLSWVSRDQVGGFFAIDHQNRLIVPGGFDDVGPFRHGVAPVLRGGWGAIDRHGRMVVQPKYYRFATVLVGGRAVDGFTEEGLAVVDAGDRLGVVDVSGQLLVAPVHAALVIHPVAFLIADRHGRWGALDRNGEPLIDMVHRSEADVAREMDRLLADTRPVL